MVIRLAVLTLLLGICYAQEISEEEMRVPAWIIVGIAKVETRSYWGEDGALCYIDRRTGAAGEVGPFQMLHAAYAQVHRHGESFRRLRSDTRFATDLCIRYLQWLRRRTKSWEEACACYNTGLHGSVRIGNQYLLMVQLAAGITP